jgi:MFS family permease
MDQKYRLEPPNGAYGWIIVFGAQLINIFNQSLISVFGLIFGPLFNSLRMSKKDITLVMNVTNLLLNLSGLLTTILIKTFSARKITIVGCLLISIGVMITSQASSMMQILIFYCLMVGIGLGLITNSAMVIVTSYFTTKKSQAVSLTLAGSGIGEMNEKLLVA